MLEGKIAVVTGASRGAGRGIALALGEAGATVYVTGRSVRGATTHNRPETINDTAEAVLARGGMGIPVRCDHTQAAEVAALFERVGEEQGHLDILVNAVWGGNEQYDGATFGGSQPYAAPFWQHSLQRWHEMIDAGVWAYLLASYYAAPLMIAQEQGLIAHVADGDGTAYRGNLFWDLSHEAINRMAYGMAVDLAPHKITAVAITPGFMRTERVLEANVPPEQMAVTESPEYIGRAIAQLAADPQALQKSGQILHAADLAQHYGFTDIDGRVIPRFDPTLF